MRKPVIAGNWKMYKVQSEVVSTLEALRKEVDDYEGSLEVVVCPTFTSLAAAADALRGSVIRLGAQNAHWESEGAFTGEISTEMLEDVGCRYVILGHSERRQYFHETDELIARKLKKTLDSSLIPILCVGESLDEREEDRVSEVVLGQLQRDLAGLTESEISRMIVAYEPVWAIGTGKTATPEIAQEVHGLIRDWLTETYSKELSDGIRILYGGSVKPANVVELMAQPDLDGALVGGASLEAESFSKIVKFAEA